VRHGRRRARGSFEEPGRERHDGGFMAPRPLAAMTGSRELAVLLVSGFAFGLVMAAVKGQDAGVRDAVGNMSAPWVLLPFLAGTRYPRILHSALAGVAITLAAFFGFYLAEAAILDLGPLPWYTDLRLTLGSGHAYEAWGIASGFLYGALGGLWRVRSLVAAPIALGLTFICEPLVVLTVERTGLWGGGGLLDYRWLWITEVAIGLAITCVVFGGARARPGSAR
jgi:hypothetical protein